MELLSSELREPIKIPGFFVAEEKDWFGLSDHVAEAQTYDHGVLAPDIEGLYPTAWRGIVHQVEIQPSGDFHEVVVKTVAGPSVAFAVMPGALMEVAYSRDGIIEVSWEPHDGDESLPLYWDLVVGGTSLKLRRLSATDVSNILEFEIPADRDFLERVLTSASQASMLRPVSFPLPLDDFRIEAHLVRVFPSGREQCVSIEVWFAVGPAEDPLSELVLVARLTEMGWGDGYGASWLDACVDSATSQPYQLAHRDSVVLDQRRVAALIKLFAREKIYRDSVMLCADPPGRLTTFSDLPLQIQDAVRSALEKERLRPTYLRGTGDLHRLRILEGVVEGGLSSRLDSLMEAMAPGIEQTPASSMVSEESAWARLENLIHVALGPTFVSRAQVKVSANISEEANYGNLIVLCTFDEGVCSVEAQFEYIPEGQQSISDEYGYLEMEDYWSQLDNAVPLDVFTKLGFSTEDIEYKKEFSSPLFDSEVIGRQVTRILQALELGTDCRVDVGKPTIDSSPPSKRVWN